MTAQAFSVNLTNSLSCVHGSVLFHHCRDPIDIHSPACLLAVAISHEAMSVNVEGFVHVHGFQVQLLRSGHPQSSLGSCVPLWCICVPEPGLPLQAGCTAE